MIFGSINPSIHDYDEGHDGITDPVAGSVVLGNGTYMFDKILGGLVDMYEYMGVEEVKPYALRMTQRAQAIRHAVMHAEKDDIILLVGKGHETYEIDRTGRHHFDERAIVREAVLERMQCEKDDR